MQITAFTDGAVRGNGGPGRVGMGVVLLHKEGTQVLHHKEFSHAEDREYATNNYAELMAIKYAAEGVLPEMREKVDLTIISDSEWCIKAIEGKYRISKNVELVLEIRNLLSTFRSWKFQWVRGHAGNEFNERANDLAQEAAGTAR